MPMNNPSHAREELVVLQDAATTPGNGNTVSLDATIEVIDIVVSASGVATVIVELDEGDGFEPAFLQEPGVGVLALIEGNFALNASTRQAVCHREHCMRGISLRARIDSIGNGSVTATAMIRRR